MKKPSYPTITTDEMLAAAVAAFRINGGEYVKEDRPTVYDQESRTIVSNPDYKRPNGALTRHFIEDNSQITDSDRQLATEIRTFVQKTLLVKILKNDTIGDFENKMLTIANEEALSSAPVNTSVAAFIPEYYKRENTKRTIEDRLEQSDREYIAAPDTKITTEMEVIRIVYSQKYSCFFISGLTTDNKRVFFAYSGSTQFEVNQKYSIKATVKRHDGDWVTVLGRVKPTKI